MDGDRNMAIINQVTFEMPEDWVNVIQNARVKPSPIQVIDIYYTFFRNWSSFLDPYYMTTNPIATRSIRQIVFKSEHSRLVDPRSSFNGYWTSTPIRSKISYDPLFDEQAEFLRKEFVLPNILRKGNSLKFTLLLA